MAGRIKRFFSAVGQKAKKRIEGHKARRRAIKRGMRGIPEETVARVRRGLRKQASARGLSTLEQKQRRGRVATMMVTKNLLDTAGIVEPEQRKGIQKLTQEIRQTAIVLEHFGKRLDKDPVLLELMGELQREIGGSPRRLEDFLNFMSDLVPQIGRELKKE